MSNFEENREWANGIAEKLEHADHSTILDYLEALEDKWSIKQNFSNSFSKISNNFGILELDNFDDIDSNSIEIEKNKIIWELTGVYNKFKKLIDINEESYKQRWEKLFETFYYCERLIRTTYILNRIKEEKYDYSLNEDNSALFKFVPINTDKNTSYQNLLLYLLEELAESEYARYGDSLYKKIKTKKGYQTYAWEQHKKIKEYIIEKCRKTVKFDQWKNMTASANNLKQAVDYLTECPDDELLSLEKDRHIFSYKNGVFITKVNKGTEDEPYWGTLFFEYGKPMNTDYINGKTVSSKYFDYNFNDYSDLAEDDWFTIMKDCPNFKKILDYQEFTDDVQMWLCVFMGKMGYELGELENWQAVMYLLGQAGAGKSTILTKILQKWYEEDDVGIIPNNIEKQFGLKPHINRKIVLAPEMQGDCKLEQTDWQLIVEGGKNSFAEKNKNAESEYWKVPMAMAGNTIIKYKAQSEQVSRRTVVWNFKKKVYDTDTQLDKKLGKEMPMIMKMCITGYHWAVNKYGDKGIWKILPEYFHENKDEMEQTTNSLQHFLKSSKVILSSTRAVPEKVFKQAFNEHCRENNIQKETWCADFYTNTFSNNGITIKKRLRRKYPEKDGELMTATFFLGIDIQNEDDGDNNNEEPE